jgi:multiple sugar transport system substrate-binding protein
LACKIDGAVLNRHGKRTDANTEPEGPYEAEAIGRSSVTHDLRYSDDTVRMIDFVSDLRLEGSRALRIADDLRELGIVLTLVGDHFRGHMTTLSSLAQASGMSYTTAYRTIEQLIANGLISQRPRTATGKSYSLHPSADLLSRWHEFARILRRKIESDLGLGAGSHSPARRRSGSRRKTPAAPGTIPPLAPLERKLALPRGLRGLVHADPTFMTMNVLKQQFELTLGVGITSRALSIDRLRSEIVANSERRVSAYDFVACDLPWFGEMVDRGRLLPLDDHIRRDHLDVRDFLPDAVASTRRGGRIYGLPVITTAELMCYRSDLFAAAGLEPPVTTDRLLDAARQLHQPARGLCGVVWNGARGTPLGHTFITTMAAHGQAVVDLKRTADGFAAEDASGANLRPMFDSPEALRVAQYLMELMQFSPPDILTTTWYDRARIYARGGAAMAYCHTLLAHLFELDPASPAHGNTGYLPPPPGNDARAVSPLGGYAIAIPANIAPDRIAAVWEGMRVMTSPGAAKLFVANGSLASPRFSVNRDPEVAGLSPVIGIVDRMARDGVLRMWPRPPVDGISGIITVAGEEIHDMLQGRRSPREALARAQDRATDFLRSRRVYAD